MTTKSFVTLNSSAFRTLTLATARTAITIYFLAKLKLQSDLRTLKKHERTGVLEKGGFKEGF
jgi:hypothetical protein